MSSAHTYDPTAWVSSLTNGSPLHVALWFNGMMRANAYHCMLDLWLGAVNASILLHPLYVSCSSLCDTVHSPSSPWFLKKCLHKGGLCIIFVVRHNYVPNVISPWSGCMILDTVFNLAQLQFPHLQNRDASNGLELLWGLDEMMQGAIPVFTAQQKDAFLDRYPLHYFSWASITITK